MKWRLWFAWHPVICQSGQFAFMETVHRAWDENANSWCESGGYSGSDGGWVYKRIGDS